MKERAHRLLKISNANLNSKLKDNSRQGRLTSYIQKSQRASRSKSQQTQKKNNSKSKSQKKQMRTIEIPTLNNTLKNKMNMYKMGRESTVFSHKITL